MSWLSQRNCKNILYIQISINNQFLFTQIILSLLPLHLIMSHTNMTLNNCLTVAKGIILLFIFTSFHRIYQSDNSSEIITEFKTDLESFTVNLIWVRSHKLIPKNIFKLFKGLSIITIIMVIFMVFLLSILSLL